MDTANPSSKSPEDLYELLDGAFGNSDDDAYAIYEKKGWTLASLVDSYLILWRQLRDQAQGPLSLESLSRKKIFELLADDADFDENLDSVLKTLEGGSRLSALVTDKHVPYPLLRKLLNTGRLNVDVDIDEYILQNDAFISRCAHHSTDDYLVSLDQLIALLESSPDFKVKRHPGLCTDQRVEFHKHGCTSDIGDKDPSKPKQWTFERARKVAFETDLLWQPKKHDFGKVHLVDAEEFADALMCMTRGFLAWIPWDCVLVAGRQIFALLTKGEEAFGHISSGGDDWFYELEILFYGVDVDAANSIVESLLAAYSQLHDGALFTRNSRGIEIASELGGSVQIALRLFKSKTEALSSYQLDANAVGFDGQHVLMLPRCARALEDSCTNLFTMDLVCNNPLEIARGWSWCDVNLNYGFAHTPIRANLAYFSSSRKLEDGCTRLKDKVRLEFAGPGRRSDRIFDCNFFDPGLPVTLGRWGSRFEAISSSLWRFVLRPLICEKLGFAPHHEFGAGACMLLPHSTCIKLMNAVRGYLTRRIRRILCFPASLEEYRRRQVAIPIPIPKALELVLSHHLGEDLPLPLVPVYNSSYHDSSTDPGDSRGPIPPLVDSTDPNEANLRFWIISKTGMWAGQNDTLDEILEILRCLALQVEDAEVARDTQKCNGAAMAKSVLSHVRTRLRLCKVPREFEGRICRGKLDSREEALFGAWLSDAPRKEDYVSSTDDDDGSESGSDNEDDGDGSEGNDDE